MSVAGSLLTRVRLYEAVRRKGSRRSIRQAAHGWPAVHRVRRRCHRPVSCAWAARHPSTAVAAPAACPRCTRALATGSQNSAGARAAQRPRRLWRSSFPTPDAVSLVQTVAHCSQCGTGHLSAHDGRERRAPIPGCSCRFVRVCFYHETVISPPRPATAPRPCRHTPPQAIITCAVWLCAACASVVQYRSHALLCSRMCKRCRV